MLMGFFNRMQGRFKEFRFECAGAVHRGAVSIVTLPSPLPMSTMPRCPYNFFKNDPPDRNNSVCPPAPSMKQ
jgi:hypothetical protein